MHECTKIHPITQQMLWRFIHCSQTDSCW